MQSDVTLHLFYFQDGWTTTISNKWIRDRTDLSKIKRTNTLFHKNNANNLRDGSHCSDFGMGLTIVLVVQPFKANHRDCLNLYLEQLNSENPVNMATKFFGENRLRLDYFSRKTLGESKFSDKNILRPRRFYFFFWFSTQEIFDKKYRCRKYALV